MNIIPISIKINEKNPERVYNAVKGENTYLLESSEGPEKVARYSIIGFNPAAKLNIKDGRVEFKVFDKDLHMGVKGKNPIEIMRNLTKQFRTESNPGFRFFGGFVGYFSYDIVRYLVDLKGQRNDLKEPDCEFILAKNNVIFDHKEDKTYLISHQFLDKREIDREEVINGLSEISDGISSFPDIGYNGKKGVRKEFGSNMTRNEFEYNVNAAKDYIYDGDIFQTVLSQRFESEFVGEKFDVYKALKIINPSPYMYYLDFGDRKIVGSSPEMLVRVEKRGVETYPIAGTRRRGKNPAEDRKLEKEMLRDEKERAEHVMLVDLGRNDIGRVSEFGTVKVRKFMNVEKYSHVQHMVSEVVGRLRRDKDEFDALESIFPAGTVSGAPKVRAMEIINELEPTRRGIYAGCVGYVSFSHNMDMAISIRTIIFEKDKAYIQAGAGIVADSKPEREYQETVNKGMGMMKALGMRK